MPKISSALNPEHLSEKIPIPILPYILVPEQEHQLECQNLGYINFFFVKIEENQLFMKNIFCRDSIKAHLQKTKDAMPQGLMREVMETYKPNLLSRRRR